MKRTLLFSLIIAMITLSSFAGTIRKDPLKKGDKFTDVNIVLNERAQYIENLEKRIEAMEKLVSVPGGAVVPFVSVECPDGWERYEKGTGRTIIGIGKGERGNPYTLEEAGGEENHRLAIDEMPQHSHSENKAVYWDNGNGRKFATERGDADDLITDESVNSGDTGGSQPHNNMPPFIALQFCIKKK